MGEREVKLIRELYNCIDGQQKYMDTQRKLINELIKKSSPKTFLEDPNQKCVCGCNMGGHSMLGYCDKCNKECDLDKLL